MGNGVWITAIPNHLSDTELSREEFQNNLLLQYGIVPTVSQIVMVLIRISWCHMIYHAPKGVLF